MEKGKRALKAEACRILAWCFLLLGDSTQDHTQSIEYGKQSLTIAKETGNKIVGGLRSLPCSRQVVL